MIIDSHQNIWKYNPIRYAWIDESMSVIQKDLLPKYSEPVPKENGVDEKIYCLNKNEWSQR